MTLTKQDLFAKFCTHPDRVDYDYEMKQRQRARLTTARLARDHDDCRFLLEVLGLMPGQEPGALDVIVPPPFVS